MKKISLLPLIIYIFLVWTIQTCAQDLKNNFKDSIVKSEEDELLMFKFEPDYLTSVDERKTAIREAMKIIDTMDISDRKRRKFIKELLKNTPSKGAAKSNIAENQFETSGN